MSLSRLEEMTLRIMYSILNTLYSHGVKNRLLALTRKEIQEIMDAEGEKWNERTLYNRLRELEEKQYIGIGMKRSNAKTFFINQEGIAWMKEIETEGMEIEHERFGRGVITAIDTSRQDARITVRFSETDMRTLLLKFARFNILN